MNHELRTANFQDLHLGIQPSVSLLFPADAARGASRAKQTAALRWVVQLGAPGIFAVSFLDSAVIPLIIPGSTDLLLLWLVSRGGNPFLIVGCALAGSLAGGWTTWRIGKKGGEAAINRYVPPHWRKRVHGWSQRHPILLVFVPALLPPPIPLTPFLLAAGALGASWQRFEAALGAGRIIRYGLEGWLAVTYGRHAIHLWSAELDRWYKPILWTFIALTVAGVAFGVWKLRHPAHKSDSQIAPRRRRTA